MDIPINVEVLCADEACGRSIYLVINPVNMSITHVVVAEKAFPNIERLVPIDKILSTTPTSFHLNCSLADLSDMEAFEETDFIEGGKLESALPYASPYWFWPYGMHDAMPMPLEYKHIPIDGVAIRRGTTVNATDGQVGKVDEFLVNPTNNGITHLVLREGHLWGQKDVTIPVSDIDKITEEAVYLKTDKMAIARLPAIPVKRKWK